ncbi:hypothetical protein DEI82_08305 [Curtobacterium sp. MCBD17_019]|nr:hypothetical protein DEI82_08305 [Curtobacterium sp. MCBD17_019]
MSIEHMRERPTDGHPGWIYELVIRFPPLSAGETRELAWDVITDTEDDYFIDNDHKLKVFGIAPRGVFERARVIVQFPKSRLPEATWMLNGIARDYDGAEHAGTPSPELRNLMLIGEWEALRTGRLYGFRWQWAASHSAQKSVDVHD